MSMLMRVTETFLNTSWTPGLERVRMHKCIIDVHISVLNTIYHINLLKIHYIYTIPLSNLFSFSNP